MFRDVSVTVSSTIVRDMEKAYKVLEVVSIVDGTANEADDEHIVILCTAAETIEKLFLWDENLLGEESEYEFLLCRKLDWYKSLLETFALMYPDPDDFLLEVYNEFERFVSGDAIDPDTFDEVTQLCLTISEAIRDHLISEFRRVDDIHPA